VEQGAPLRLGVSLYDRDFVDVEAAQHAAERLQCGRCFVAVRSGRVFEQADGAA
jgi:hypothetical protein